MPPFVRSSDAIAEIATLGPEEDRIKDAGQSWDDDFDPGHYVDIGDDGTILGVVRLDALPKDMAAYGHALAAANTDLFRAGYLPYSIIDGYERVFYTYGPLFGVIMLMGLGGVVRIRRRPRGRAGQATVAGPDAHFVCHPRLLQRPAQAVHGRLGPPLFDRQSGGRSPALPDGQGNQRTSI